MFHFIIPLIKGRLIGAFINRILPRLFPIVLGVLKKQQSKNKINRFLRNKKLQLMCKPGKRNRLSISTLVLPRIL